MQVDVSSTDVCRIAEITYRQLDTWVSTGLITPSVMESDGPGSKRRYTYGDVAEVMLIKALLDVGFTHIFIRETLARTRVYT